MAQYPILKHTDDLPSPGLWVDRSATQRNIDQMIEDVGGKSHIGRLRPHVKTHKMQEVIEMQVASGILQCKAATPKEVEMAAAGGAADILLAHQLVGPKIKQFRSILNRYPGTRFGVVIDSEAGLNLIADSLANRSTPLGVWIDVDCGMHRTGISLGTNLEQLRDKIESSAGFEFQGLHVYDGHLHQPSLDERKAAAEPIIAAVKKYIERNGPTTVVGGGTPTFPVWAEATDWQCSPGTTIFWDCGYGDNYPDLHYEVAAGLITRVISKPGDNLICFDLGHKSVAAEMELSKRVLFPEIEAIEWVGQSEEHLVGRVAEPEKFQVGMAFTAIPRHICPTVALHSFATILEDGEPTGETWRVVARDR